MAIAGIGKIVSGFDFRPTPFEFRKIERIKFKNGELKLASHEKQNADLTILSHVLEHFIDATTELCELKILN